MNICVVGWYFYPKIYQMLEKVNHKYPVFVVANKYHKNLKNYNIPYHVRENIGIDFGAYNYYIEHIWDKISPILFQHDDVIVKDITTYDIVADFRNKYDQVYIFRDEFEKELNRGCQGRAIYCSVKTINLIIKWQGNVWYDPLNKGNTTICFPEEGYHYNEAICRFRNLMHVFKDKCYLNTKIIKIIPGISPARRGKW